MADDINPALRAELVAQQNTLAPQIRGEHDLIATSISPELRAQIQADVLHREHRRDLIQSVLENLDRTVTALEVLEADGYPALPLVAIDDPLFVELQGEESDLDIAVALFKRDQAVALSIGLGEPVKKP